MRHFIIAAVAACGVLAAGGAVAQDGSREALARRYVEISTSGMEKVIEAVLATELADADLDPEHRQWFSAQAPAIMVRHMRVLINGMVDDFAERFSQEELQALVDFYGSAQGRRIAYKQLQHGADGGAALMNFQVGYITELTNKFCAEFGCDVEEPSAAPANKPARR